MHHCFKGAIALLAASALTLVPVRPAYADDDVPTATPIKHLVVIFQENISFDHYFGTYPHAEPNKDGSRFFGRPKEGTPRVNNLESAGLLTNNPNGTNPFRIDRSVPNTCDQDHNYGDEQYAFDGGLIDRFTSVLPFTTPPRNFSCNDPVLGPASVLGYYDGNTVTALWNYAQHYAMSDNSYSTTFGPSSPGAINLIAGQTDGATITNNLSGKGFIANAANSGTLIGDADPAGDVCSNPARTQVQMSGKNIGDLLNEAGITWGAFMGGFGESCTSETTGFTGLHSSVDYIPHHAWFQYYASTLNAKHAPPASDSLIGKSDGVTNHQYDLSLFFKALKEHRLPAVSFLKAPAFEDGHAGYSDPIDEQIFLVNTINTLQQTPEWRDTAVIILYDDSDGWYDHVMGPVVNQSNVAEDQLLGPGNCGTPKASADGIVHNGRCGYGPRQPLLAVSPFAKKNYVDHRVTDQSSVLRFIEDNWNLGRIGGGSADAIAGALNGLFDFDQPEAGKLILDPVTGQPKNE